MPQEATDGEHPALLGGTSATLSVVVTTYNRPEGARSAVDSILAASVRARAPVEVVVVDGGSTRESAETLDHLLPEVEVVHQEENQGLCAARAAGVVQTTGDWLAFLDDDDRWLPEWCELLMPLMRDRVGIISGGARLVTPEGRWLRDDPPRPLGGLYSGITAQYLAGSFAVRRGLYEAAGGYLPGLSSSHQSELFIRMAATATKQGLGVAHTDRPVVEIERREVLDRSLSNPRLLYDGTRWILARHAEHFRRDRAERSNWEGIAALNGVRLGERAALSYAWRAALDRPFSARPWARVLAAATPLGRARWGSVRAVTPSTAPSTPSSLIKDAPLEHVAALHDAGVPFPAASDHLFLPWGYRENPPASSDAAGTPFWRAPGSDTNDTRYQTPVYRWARKLARSASPSVIDIGCGPGDKLVRLVAPHARSCLGVDQRSAIEHARRRFPDQEWWARDLEVETTWKELRERPAELVLCADVVEHLADPRELLVRLRSIVAPGGSLLVSTPDRSRLEGVDPLGPPRNPRHVREWTEDEFRLLVESAGFHVEQVRHLLPRSYSMTVLELKRVAHRAAHLRRLPDRRYCMAFLLTPRPPRLGQRM